MKSISCRHLDSWIPLLLSIWRKHVHKKGYSDRLSRHEADEMAGSIRLLSEGLTRDRALAGEKYFSDPAMLGAYLLYFWPVSYAQAAYVLNRLHPAPKSVLDLGSGPGPFGCACLDAGAQSVTFADRSRPALRLAAGLVRLSGRQAKTQVWDPLQGAGLPKATYDLIALSHVLNELWAHEPDRIHKRTRLVESLFPCLRPNGKIAFIEPALTATSRDLMQVRDSLLAKGHVLDAPCLRTGPCPALDKPNDTCHSEFTCNLPPLVQALVQRAGFQKRSLKMTYMIFSAPESKPAATTPNQNLLLIVSDPLLSKNGRIRLIGCGPQGRLSLAMKPAAATDSNRAFLSAGRGDLLRIQAAVPREGGLDITAGTRVTKVPAKEHACPN